MVAQINTELLGWANQNLTQWQQEAFRRLLSKSDLTDKDKNELFDRALIDLGFKQLPTPLPELSLTAIDLPPLPSPKLKVRLLSLRQVQNLNALKAGQRISFGKQLTVIFGENASGKSGYVRLMKAACAAKVVEDLLPDVFATSAPKAPPSAAFEIETISEAGATTPSTAIPMMIPWEKGTPSPSVLKRYPPLESLTWIISHRICLIKKQRLVFHHPARGMCPNPRFRDGLSVGSPWCDLMACFMLQTRSASWALGEASSTGGWLQTTVSGGGRNLRPPRLSTLPSA
jgi:hypothetical protein